MVGSKTSAGFSWADEVEKEEEEEAQAQALLQRQKPNPFGFARPREIVLQERGIDWRNLDHQLQSSSLRNEKNQSKPIPQPAVAVDIKNHFSVIGGFEQNNRQIQNAGNVHDHIVQSSAFSYQQKQNTEPSVPPLCYPPQNLFYVMEKTQRLPEIGRAKLGYARHLCEFNLEQEYKISTHMRNFDAKEDIWKRGKMETLVTPSRGGEKENMESRFGRNCVGKRLISLSAENLLDRERQVNLNREMKKPHFQGDDRDRWVQSASERGRQSNVESTIARRQVSLNCQLESAYLQGDNQDRLVKPRIRKGGDPRNVEREIGRRNHFDSNAEGAHFGGNYERGGSGFWGMECGLISTPVQGRVPYNLNSENRGSRKNFRKRATASTSETIHHNQRRR